MLPKPNYQLNDKRYLLKSDYESPKEYFKLIGDLIRSRSAKTETLLDVGCAAGGFIYYLKRLFPHLRCSGLEISPKHIEHGKQIMPDVDWILGSIEELGTLIISKFNLVTCLGTLAIFDDIEPLIKNMHDLLTPAGSLYIFDLVNDYPIDVVMRYRKVFSEGESDWQPGFNARSPLFYSKVADNLSSKTNIKFHEFRMPFPLTATSDPMRAWTIQTSDNHNQLVVGTNQLLNFKVVEFTKT